VSRESDAAARRALAAAVLGSFLLPVVAHAYSIWLATAMPWATLSRSGRRHRVAALTIDILYLGLALYLLLRH
jgi:hypothetical protein